MNSVLKHTLYRLVFLLQLHRSRIFQYLRLVGLIPWRALGGLGGLGGLRIKFALVRLVSQIALGP